MMGLLSRHVDDSGLETEREVFAETRAQVVLALRLFEMTEDTHLRAVLRAARDLPGRGEMQLRVPGIPETRGGEGRHEERRDGVDDGLRLRIRQLAREPLFLRVDPRADLELGLAAIAARRARSVADEAETRAALLSAHDVELSRE